MNLPLLLTHPLAALLFKWTCLLALAWIIHAALRTRHARWRMMLWRSVLCFGLVLPWLHFFQIPGIKIPVSNEAAYSDESNVSSVPTAAVSALATPAVTSRSPQSSPAVPASAIVVQRIPKAPTAMSWPQVLVFVWALGCVIAVFRLLRLQAQLSRLRRDTCRPDPILQAIVNRIQLQLRVPQKIDVQVSDVTQSPFLCGLIKPAIILPRALAENLSPAQVSALLRHEIAHLLRHDLFWCAAWQWIRTLCWFHPLVWAIPAAHNLACEQEADRIARAQEDNPDLYPQFLAQLALRVLALPEVETRLTVNGSSQIARRLTHLGRKLTAWDWRHSAAGFCLVALLFVITAGFEFSSSGDTAALPPKSTEFKQVLVTVQDENGIPVEGATVVPSGFRVKGIHGADAYPWNKKLFGDPVKVTTDSQGKAYVKYPVMGIPEEKELTGKITIVVSHPGFATVRPQDYSVDGSEKPIQLTHGVRLQVSGYFGTDHQPVPELVPNINEDVLHIDDWQKEGNGVLAVDKISPGSHLLQLMGRLPSGQIVYSEPVSFDAEIRKPYTFNLEMKPGIRIEGRIDDQVPRPVKNGRVIIAVRPPQFVAWTNYDQVDDMFKKYDWIRFWKSQRPIAEDGTFVFESVPPGELDVIVHGDGFVSRPGADFMSRSNSVLVKYNVGMPQAFALSAPVTKIEVATEPTATLELTTKTKSGKPVPGATVYLSPNVLRINGIFGILRKADDAVFMQLPPLPELHYSATTDKNGIAIVRNVPAFTSSMEIEHPLFQTPLQEPKGWRDRHIRTQFSPGMTNKVEFILEPKGSDYIGSR